MTPEQEIMTDKGWTTANSLKIGDKLISKYEHRINGNLKDFLFGCFCGDSYLSIRDKNTACLIFQNTENPAYLKWKLNKLKPFYKFKKNRETFYSKYSYELKKMKDLFGRRNPLIMLNNYSDLSFAIWIMDDGHFNNRGYHHNYIISVKRFKNNKLLLDKIGIRLKELGFNNTINNKDGSIRFTVESSDIIANKIYKYIPASMQYKLPLKYRMKYRDFKLHNKLEIKEDFVKVLLIRNASKRQMRDRNKFNIHIKDNNNYFAGGIRNGILIRGHLKKR